MVERRVGRIPGRGCAAEQLLGHGERVGAAAPLACREDDLRGFGRNGTENLPGQERLADARCALNDDARPAGRVLLDYPEHQVTCGPGDGSTVGWS